MEYSSTYPSSLVTMTFSHSPTNPTLARVISSSHKITPKILFFCRIERCEIAREKNVYIKRETRKGTKRIWKNSLIVSLSSSPICICMWEWVNFLRMFRLNIRQNGNGYGCALAPTSSLLLVPLAPHMVLCIQKNFAIELLSVCAWRERDTHSRKVLLLYVFAIYLALFPHENEHKKCKE